MKEFIDKLISRLEEVHNINNKKKKEAYKEKDWETFELFTYRNEGVYSAIETVNQLAEEYKHCTLCYLQSPCEYQNENAILPVSEFTENNGWIPCEKELPPHSDDLLLIQCNGNPRNNIKFVNAFCLASYTEEGWILEMYPDWKDAEVVAWKNLGEPYQPKGE